MLRSLALLIAATVALPGDAGSVVLAQEDERKETPAEREKRLRIEQVRALRERAAEEAEANARALEETAERLEALAAEAKAAAKEARDRATAARKKADAARRRANAAGADARRVDGERDGAAPGKDEARDGGERAARSAPREQGPPGANPAGRETDKHAAAARTARQNKDTYLKPKRARRSMRRDRIEGSMTYEPGDAPDMGDLDIYATSQWAINVARGGEDFRPGRSRGAKKTGNVDIARVSFRPSPKLPAGRSMLWGMRRYNLGDTTVVDCDFIKIRREHGIYDSLSGHGLYRGNTFEDLGGQALQIVHRSIPYKQKSADNLPLTGKPTIVVEDNHAVDCGQNAGRGGFTWTFFDPGTHRFPATLVLRGNTAVSAWGFARTPDGDQVPADHPRATRSTGGLMVTPIQHVRPEKQTRSIENVVIDNCLFDFTMSEMPIAAIRGADTILVEDSCFIARKHRNPHFDVDDIPNMPSGKVILENCVSPEGARVWLAIRGERVMPMHCPGKRFEIDVATLEIVETEPVDDPITRLISPLAGRLVRPGVRDQPLGHVDDLGAVPLRFAPLPAPSSARSPTPSDGSPR